MQVLNLIRDIKLVILKDFEIIKNYTYRLLRVVNKIKVLGEELTNKRVVEKVLVSLSKRSTTKISSLEDLRDLNWIILPKLVNNLQVQE